MVSLNVQEGHLPSGLLCLGGYLQLNLLLLCCPAYQLMPKLYEPSRQWRERTNVLDIPHARRCDRRHPRLLRILGILVGVDALDGRVDLGECFRHVERGGVRLWWKRLGGVLSVVV